MHFCDHRINLENMLLPPVPLTFKQLPKSIRLRCQASVGCDYAHPYNSSTSWKKLIKNIWCTVEIHVWNPLLTALQSLLKQATYKRPNSSVLITILINTRHLRYSVDLGVGPDTFLMSVLGSLLGVLSLSGNWFHGSAFHRDDSFRSNCSCQLMICMEPFIYI